MNEKICQFILRLLNFKKVHQEYTYNAGVLVIGSLYWDSDHGRDIWRINAFGENYLLHKRDLPVPICYGRYSEGRKCPTMVFRFSNEAVNTFGNGKLIPYRRRNLNLDQLFAHAEDLSEAEGRNSRVLIKGNQDKWCIVLAWLNTQMSADKKDYFVKYWRNKYHPEIDQSIINNFKYDDDRRAIFDLNGLLQFEMPNELKDLDIVFVTQTKPLLSDGSKTTPAAPEIIANQIYIHPEYFIKNRLNGITTGDDNLFMEILKRKDREQLERNAISNGCSKQELELFLNQEKFT